MIRKKDDYYVLNIQCIHTHIHTYIYILVGEHRPQFGD